MRKTALLYLNGKRCEIGPDQAGMMLGDFLRYERGLTGTKIVCAEGDCGACTVLRFFPKISEVYLPINSCITTVAQMDGSSLITVDALATSELTPTQNAMRTCHGSQCGFCTPGFVMAISGLVEKKLCAKENSIGEKEAKNALTGNLCRCTGYQPILDAAVSIDLKDCESLRKRFYSKAQDQDLKKALSQALHLESVNFSFFAPRTLKEASAFLVKNKDAKILGAATDLGVVHNKRKIRLQKTLSLHLIPELYKISRSKSSFLVGSRVTLSELREKTKKFIPEFAHFLDLFASPQIKNVATLAGNVGNASPIADTPPALLALGAVVHVFGKKGKRKIPLEQFYLSYRKTDLRPGDIIAAIEFSIPKKTETLKLYKASQRKDLDISAVNAAFRIALTKSHEIEEIHLAMGGIAATPIRLKNTEKLLLGQKITASIISDAVDSLQSEIEPLSDLRGSSSYRRVIAENFLNRFFREIEEKS